MDETRIIVHDESVARLNDKLSRFMIQLSEKLVDLVRRTADVQLANEVLELLVDINYNLHFKN